VVQPQLCTEQTIFQKFVAGVGMGGRLAVAAIPGSRTEHWNAGHMVEGERLEPSLRDNGRYIPPAVTAFPREIRIRSPVWST
jgi:hypothetical protein